MAKLQITYTVELLPDAASKIVDHYVKVLAHYRMHLQAKKTPVTQWRLHMKKLEGELASIQTLIYKVFSAKTVEEIEAELNPHGFVS